MLEKIKHVLLDADVRLFRFINTNLHNDLLAGLMKFTANDVFLSVLVIGGLVLLAKNNRKTWRADAAFSLWALISAFALSTYMLKPFFKRLRPVAELPDVNFLVFMRKYGWAFPSTHTAMATALATVLWDTHKNLRWLFALFVACVGFFCVYTGGHYPSDVVAGFVLGLMVGSVFKILNNISQKYKV